MCCTLGLGTSILIPSGAASGFGQPHISPRHCSPCTAPAKASDGCPWMGASLICWDTRVSQGAMAHPGDTVFSHCPNTVLCFVSPAELCRLHHGREEAEEWAAPQIVSVGGSGWVPSLPQVSPLHKTPCCAVEACFFCLWGVGKWVQPSPKKWTGGLERAAQGCVLSSLTPIFSPLSKATSPEQSPQGHQVLCSALGHHDHQPCSAGQL